ncbi:MAG: response regulator [Deltaproteobacteria bacterium]|jgi:twitching motility two-component system response regulator PilH|nr:response regulator [Desulfobacterales bacterium]MDL1980866.1 response regulator [Deltaproteobacteria bacterium]MDL1987273.1 response regulator [Deltaproteobacteria bacterium]MDL2123857.1 response regulator [Deltaproteobacteria bacterium]
MAKKVLIVDDDVDVRTFASSVVEDSGYKPEIAKDGEEGIGKVKEEKPALIILDILMPKESGIKMYRALKTDSQFSDIPVIVLSGIAKRTFLRSQKALDEFGDQPVPEPEAYLEKPVEPEELGAMIKKLLS